MTSPQIEAFAQLGQLWKQAQTEFAESLPVSDPDVLQMVQDLLEEETGPVDRIVDLTIDDTDTFRGRAEQRISLGRSQTLQFIISPERMSYKLVGNASFGETDEEWAEIIEFAAKAKKKLNCKPGNVQCGGKCQSGSKNCFADMSPDQKKKAQAAAKKAKAGGSGKDKPGAKSKTKQLTTAEKAEREKLNPDFHSLYDMARGVKTPDEIKLSKEDIEAAKYFMDEPDGFAEPKIKRIRKDNASISEDEANALATWTGYAYGDMNKRIYAPDSFSKSYGDDTKTLGDQVMTANVLAAKALHKLPPITTEQIQQRAQAKGRDFSEDQPLQRFMTMDNPAAFVKRYQESQGKDILEETFFATTHLKKEEMGYFSGDANVRYVVKPKLDGTGQGRYVDHYKNKADEGEVLYPPMSRFRVARVGEPPTNLPTDAEKSAMNLLEKIDLYKSAYGKSDWKFAYKTLSGNKPPTKKQLEQAEKLAESGKQKQQALQGIDFNGYTIELEEI